MSDYKYEMQLLAEQAAEDQFGKDFYSLASEQQDKLYREAMDDWHDNKVSQAESRGEP